MQKKDPRIWLIENEGKWYTENGEMHFTIPLDQVPIEVLENAQAYKKQVENSRRRMNLLHSMGVGVDDSWD